LLAKHVLLSDAGSASSDSPSGQQVNPSPVGTSAKPTPRNPLPRFPQTYGWNANTVRDLYRRWQDAVVECMNAAGYADYVRFPTPEGDFIDIKYDDMDRAAIAVHGLRPPDPPNSGLTAEEDQTQARVAADPAFAKALAGSETLADPGCAGSSRRQVYGESPSYPDLIAILGNLDSEVYGRTAASEEYRLLDAEWAACMNSVGQPFTQRSGLFEASWPQPAPSAAEIAAALADFDCREQTAFQARYLAIYSRFFSQVQAEQEGQLIEIQQRLSEFNDQ
jgi:hypothetical protein